MFRSRSPAIGKGRSNRRSPVKRQRRLNGVDEIVLSLYAKGLTTGEISAHFAEIFPRKWEGPQAPRSRKRPSRGSRTRCRRKCRTGLPDRSTRYTLRFSSMRSSSKSVGGQVANRPIFPRKREGPPAAIGVSLDGHCDVLGLWAGTGGEGAKFFDERADRHPKSGHPGRVLPGLRRTQRPTGGRPRTSGRPRRYKRASCI